MRGSRGAALIAFLGIMIALSIMSVALVTVLANAQHSTSREKSRTTAFDVAEAAIDVSMQLLTEQWADAEHPWSESTLFDRDPGFASQFGVQPGLTGDNSLWVSVFDDVSGDILAAPHFDDNAGQPNGYVWVDAQARVNGVASRIRTMVQRETYEFGMAKGIVVYAGGNLISNAVGENKTNIGAQDVTVGGPQPVSIVIHGDISSDTVAWPYVDQHPPEPLPEREELISDQTIEDITLYAQSTGKYFTRQPTPQELTGLCVVDVPSGTVIRLDQQQEPYNSIAHPGVLMVLGGGALKLGGNVVYNGLVYTEGSISVSHGTPTIYGMIICEGDFDMGGVAQVIYREDCLARLDKQFQTNTKLVPNFWRELTPLTSAP